MIDEHFVWVGVGLLFIGGGLYIKDIIAGKVRPNIVTWFLWGLAPLIAFTAQLQHGIGASAWLTFAVGFCPAVIFFVALKKGFVHLTKLDYVCGGVSLLAILAWQLTQDSAWAIILSIMADGLAATPTIIKSFRDPDSESPTLFLLFVVSALITLLTIKSWTLENSAFALYIFALYIALFVLVRFRVGYYLTQRQVVED
ncbi:MAG TPA: hypothetical protein VFH06_04505 [Candidatus Saccharimonadales bacterium]|nr:hypothetical protein [Candidatus Saccharimonadales bacterium]